MKKEFVESRRKFITNTYMREALDYDILTIKEDNLFITIKKYKTMSGNFSLLNEDGNEAVYIDNGYFVVELTPIDENYNIRYYFDDKKNYIDYYIDITYENGVMYKMPYYVDLYLDIIHYPKENTIEFVDEDELKDALKSKVISKRDYDMAYEVGNKLIEELRNGTNKYMNIDVKKYLDMMN